MGYREHVNYELHDFARREILPEIATKERPHECLKRAPFAIKVCLAKVYIFQIANNCSDFFRGQTDVVTEYFLITFPVLLV